MDPRGLTRTCFLLVSSICVCVVTGTPIGTSTINCDRGGNERVGEVEEGYTGDVEVLNGIPAGSGVKLVPFIFPKHLEYLELSFTPGQTSTTVRTKKPLDADALASSDRTLYYSVMCDGDFKFNNTRTLKIIDLNDNSPVFTQAVYSVNVSETHPVDTEVLRVKAVDGDSSIENNHVIYSFEPTSEFFMVRSDSGAFMLKRRLNYNVVPQFTFTVTAKDNWGRNDTATVLMNVMDFDNMNPYFSLSLYRAFIPENQVGFFRTVHPEAIKAQDGDKGINVSVTYSISTVSPDKYQRNFDIDSLSGVLSVVTNFDREEVNSAVISVGIKAAQADDRLKTADAVVYVTVEDVNDSAPKFDRPEYSVALVENSPDRTVLFKAIVTDLDQGGFVGTLQILPESAPFSIGSDGTIRVTNSTALDREATDDITFQIEAREAESPNRVAAARVSVALLDENDNSPKFTSNKYEGKVFVNQTEEMLLVQVKADDVDAGVNGQVKYSIAFGNDDGYFSINENTGEVSLAKTIPLEQNRILEFPLYIKATDGGTIPRTSATQVKIHAPGDSKPQFLQDCYRGTIEEEQEPEVTILMVDFLAIAIEIPVTLQVLTEADKFSISSRGELTTKVKLDYDEAPHVYSVEISISDGVSNDSAVVEVHVTDVNDNSPVFASSSVTESVPEDAQVGSNVTVVAATDKDSGFNKEIRYSLRGGEGRFSIDPVSGMVSVIAALDRESGPSYTLLVVAEDQGRPVRSATSTLVVTVSDVNDNVPEFSKDEYHADVSETESVGTSLLTLSAVDADEGLNGRVTYRIVRQSPSSNPAVFKLHPSNGTLWLVQPLDYSEVKVYSLTVQASDSGTPSLVGNSSVVVKVKDVNNNPPEFSKESYDVSVSENLPSGASILTLEVTDKDEGGFVGTLRILPESAPFSISSNGSITVTNSTALDREATGKFVFQIEARETKPPNHVAVANVSVTLLDENDNSPKFTSSKYTSKVFTNQTQGMLLVKVEAADPDVGVNGQVKYSIEFGNDKSFFSINESTGAIELTTVIPLVPHQTKRFLLFVAARDGGTVSHAASVQVEVLAVGDSKPQFTQSSYSETTEEEREPGTMILKVGFLAVEIPVILQVLTEADKFSISSRGELTTKVKLDYDEAPHVYSVEISISDGVSNDSAVVEVHVTDVNDNSPVFASSSVTESVPEDAQVGSNVTVVAATDKDSGFNKEIRYSLRGGEGRFSIDPVSGMVSVIAALDRESGPSYTLLVVAEDQGRPVRSATSILMVTVSDVNDNVPEFSKDEYHADVSETESVGTSLLTLSAVDADEGLNGRVTYRIVRQSPSSNPAVFKLHPSNGTLWLVQPLDYSEVKVYSLTVQASDSGTPSLVGNSSVVVKVKDVNNNPPEFSKESYDVSVSEILPSGASILTLEVTDKDEHGFSNGYFLSTSETFDMNKYGVVSLRTNATLDRETKDSYIFQVVAVDQQTSGLRATALVNITVLDDNDNNPQFPQIPDPLLVPEGDYSEENPQEVFTIVPTDDDLGPNGEVTLSLVSPQPLFRFTEDGTLLAVGCLDRESRETYELLVKASDRGHPERENVTSLRVNVSDVNDNAPQFSSSSYISSVLLKDAEEGKLLLTLSATDRDAGDNSLVSYSFSAGSSPYVALNSKTGAVTLTSDLAGVTEDTTLELTAVATDHGRPRLNSTARVVVNLRTLSLVEGVAFQTSSYNFSVLENQPAGVQVGRVHAQTGSYLYDVAYSLRTHTDLFSVNTSGAVLTKAWLDKEQQEWYVLEVEAVDTRNPPTSAVAMVRVQVEDMNEPPHFSSQVYKSSIFSIAPYKTSVTLVQATDPDMGDASCLDFSLSSDSVNFDVDPSSGLVFVVSAADLDRQTVTVEVKVTDPGGLDATATVEVEVRGNAELSDVVTISVNRPANVEKKVTELEKSLGSTLCWTVDVIEVTVSTGGRTPGARTVVGFVSTDAAQVVSADVVTKKIQGQSEAVRAGLVKVFGEGLQFEVAVRPPGPAPQQTAVIALATTLALSIMGLTVAVLLILRFQRKKKHEDSDKDSFHFDRHESFTNRNVHDSSEQETRLEVAQWRTDMDAAKRDEWTENMGDRNASSL